MMKMYKTVGQLVKEGVIKEGTDLREFGFKVNAAVGEWAKILDHKGNLEPRLYNHREGSRMEVMKIHREYLELNLSAEVSVESTTNVEQDTVDFKGKTYYVEDNVMTEKKTLKVGDFVAIEDMPDDTTVQLTATVRKGKLVFNNLDFKETVVDVYERAGFEIVRLPEDT